MMISYVSSTPGKLFSFVLIPAATPFICKGEKINLSVSYEMHKRRRQTSVNRRRQGKKKH